MVKSFEARRARDLQNPLLRRSTGTLKGVSAMTLIANHAAINARVIGANEHESLDLLMSNTSDIISGCAHRYPWVNHVNFALLDLFGYRFIAPRYAQVGK